MLILGALYYTLLYIVYCTLSVQFVTFVICRMYHVPTYLRVLMITKTNRSCKVTAMIKENHNYVYEAERREAARGRGLVLKYLLNRWFQLHIA